MFDTASALIDQIAGAGWKRPDGKPQPKSVTKPRDGKGPATAKQKALLRKHGLRDDVTFGEASNMLDAVAANGWEVPSELEHMIVEDSELEVPAFGGK
jgi:hypothetical protein